MGENVTTRGVDLLGLPTGTRLRLGPEAIVEVTGLRNPCRQLEGVHEGSRRRCSVATQAARSFAAPA
jgi:MOSC domain-containing protein YiiM